MQLIEHGPATYWHTERMGAAVVSNQRDYYMILGWGASVVPSEVFILQLINYFHVDVDICRKHGGLDMNTIPRDEAEDLINKIAALEDQVSRCLCNILALIIF